MQIRPALKTVSINVAVLLGLVLGLLFLTALAGDLYNLGKAVFPKDDKRADLPAYEDHDYARLIYRQQRGSIKDYIPFVEWRRAPVQSETLNIDANGRRVHSIGRDNAAGAVSTGFFGGSTVWGTGVDDNGTLPAQFDLISKDYAVVNYGERGYTTLQNLVDLMTLINTRQAPDLVIFFEGFNDVWVHCDYAVTDRLNAHMEEKRIQSALDRTGKEDYLYNTILVPILAFVTRLSGDDVPHQAACSNDPQRAEAVAEMFVSTLEMAERLVTANGGRFYAFLQPHAFVGNPRSDYLRLDRPRDDAQRAQFAAVYPLIRQKMAEREHSWWFDVSDALDGEDYLLVDHAHVNPEGNRRLAVAIRQAIER